MPTPQLAASEPAGKDVEENTAPSDEEPIFFRSSPAMELLRIPEPPAAEAAPPAQAGGAPATKAAAWHWPVVVAIVAVTLLIVGYFVYVRSSAPSHPTAGLRGSSSEGSARGLSGRVVPPRAAATVDPSREQPRAPRAVAEAAGERGVERSKSNRGLLQPPARRRSKTTDAKQPAPAEPAAPPAAAPAPTEQGPAAELSALDSLLDKAVSGRTPEPGRRGAGVVRPDLPEQLTMQQIRAGMAKVKDLVQACYDRFEVAGTAVVSFTILGEGGVTAVAVRGDFQGTETGACVVDAVSKAQFPPFGGKPMTIRSYPFLLR